MPIFSDFVTIIVDSRLLIKVKSGDCLVNLVKLDQLLVNGIESTLWFVLAWDGNKPWGGNNDLYKDRWRV